MELVAEALKLFLGEYTLTVIILVVGLIVLVWWVSAIYHSMKHKVDAIDSLPCARHDEKIESHDKQLTETRSKMDSLPCARHDEKIESHDKQLTETRSMISRIEGQLEILVANSIEKSNERIFDSSGHNFSDKHSPRVLNQNGISLLRDCGGNDFLIQYADYFIAKIETLKPKTAYDVENYALAVLQMSTSDDMFIPIKNWIYEAPRRELTYPEGRTAKQEITLQDVLFVLSIPLRDRYLDTHPL